MNLDQSKRIAYFSMEIGLDASIPTYSGGLGVLAGDTLKSAADLGFPVTGVTLLYRGGYMRQEIDEQGRQSELPVNWRPEEKLTRTPHSFDICIEGRRVKINALCYSLRGATGHVVPIYFLDCDLPVNEPRDRLLTGSLYGGDDTYRLSQEILLGIGGVELLSRIANSAGQTLNDHFATFHMNEGHAALLTLGVIRASSTSPNGAKIAVAETRARCAFTTHTPVPAGHDRFSAELAQRLIHPDYLGILNDHHLLKSGFLNMTEVAGVFSRVINGVTKRHAEVSQEMIKEMPAIASRSVIAISNGVHATTWTTNSFKRLYDREVPTWQNDPTNLRYIRDVNADKIEVAHAEAQSELFQFIESRSGIKMRSDVFTLGFARRAAEYKRASLLFQDIERLKGIATGQSPLQVVFAGKAHPKDSGGKKLIEKVHLFAQQLKGSNITVVYLPDYDMTLGRLICAGVDVWLNTPLKPLEASGTSGMKAALNGVPSFSILDGWWV